METVLILINFEGRDVIVKNKINKLGIFSIIMMVIICISIFICDINVVYASTPGTIDVDWGLHNAQVFEAQQITKGSTLGYFAA